MVFFFNDTATTEIYTLSLHDALPIWRNTVGVWGIRPDKGDHVVGIAVINPNAMLLVAGENGIGKRTPFDDYQDRKSTRLNSSHANISYAVFCLKKKKRHVEHQDLLLH